MCVYVCVCVCICVFKGKTQDKNNLPLADHILGNFAHIFAQVYYDIRRVT